MYGYMMERAHPELVKNIVALDVATHAKPGILGMLLVVLYQWYLILCFAIGLVYPKGGDAMARAFAKLIKAPQAEKTTAAKCYPYFYFWSLIIRRSPLLRLDRSRGLVPFPILFLYGQNKPFSFHSDAFMFAISKRADSRVEAYPAGHWFLVGKFADDVNDTVAKWLGERYKVANASASL